MVNRETKFVYIDADFCCHTTDSEGIYREVETDFFYGKCDAFIEGFRFIPEGESWTREDGVVFEGEMISPWKDINELNTAQLGCEQNKLAESNEALTVLGVTV